MNADRRKRIAVLADKLDELHSELESLRDEEQEAFESMPEGLQQGERGQVSEQATESLDDAESNLSDVIETLRGIE